MKDQEKQVEEIVKVLLDCGRQFENIDTATADHNYVSYFYPIFKTYAEALVKNNVIQIHEDSVVLTKAEKQKLLHEMYEQGKFDAIAYLDKEDRLVLSREELHERDENMYQTGITMGRKFGSKETAKSILNEIEGFLWETAINDTKFFDLYQSLYRSIKEHIKNKYDVEIKENNNE